MTVPDDEPADRPVWIIADDARMAGEYARAHNLGPYGRGWRYVRDAFAVYGASRGSYAVVTRPDSRLSLGDLHARRQALDYLRAHAFPAFEGAE